MFCIKLFAKCVVWLLQVQPNSVAERCGLQAGDAILKINDMPADTLAHDDAKAEIIRSGDEIHVYVAR